MYNFSFGGIWLSELGAKASGTPDIEMAQRDGELVSIPGKNGDDYIDNGRYKNVEFSRDIAMIGKQDYSVESKVANLIEEYAYLQGYQSFEDTDHPFLITEAVLQNFGEINHKLRIWKEATLKFSRKPFWYLKSGLEFQSVDLSETTPTKTFLNPFKLPSKPIIKVTTTAGSPTSYQFQVTTDGVTKEYEVLWQGGNSTITFDSEKKTAKNEAGLFLGLDVPDGFDIGESTVKITAGKARISSFLIAPRWCCL